MSNSDVFEEDFQFYSVTVPTNFPSAGATDQLDTLGITASPNSYLRLGDTPTAADLGQQTEPGQEQREELVGLPDWPVDLYKSFAPDNSDIEPNGDVLRVNAGVSEVFEAAIDTNFYKNVGWLDHCNGHRVSTTHGDKVEVITGNYKLVVLGRDSNAENSTGLDMSGGHTNIWARTPGAIRTITSEKDEFGNDTFKVTHVTDSGHEYNVFDGFSTEHFVGGSSHLSVMGGKNDRVQRDAEGPMDLVVDATWSDRIVDTDFGTTIIDVDAGVPTPAWPDLSETNDVKTQKEVFAAAPANFDEARVLPKANKIIEARAAERIFEWVAADKFEERVDAESVDNEVEAGTVKEKWTCRDYTETFIGNRTNNTSGGFENEFHFSGLKTDITGAGLWIDINMGLARTGLEVFGIDFNLNLTPLVVDLSVAGFKIVKDPVIFQKKTMLMEDVEIELKKNAVNIENNALGIEAVMLKVLS